MGKVANKNVSLTRETACCVRITLVVGDALATCPVAAHNAVCIDSAVTRIYAFLIPACEHLGALFVDHTLGVVTFDVGVASPSVRAEAASSVISCLTARSYATLRQAAGINAGSVDALVRQRALQVAVAAR